MEDEDQIKKKILRKSKWTKAYEQTLMMLIFDNIIRKPWYNYDFDFFMEDGELRKIQCFLGKSISSIRQKLNEIKSVWTINYS